MTEEVNLIQISQTLHGYNDGHQLIATSGKLDQAVKTKLLQMSDSPGSGFNDSRINCLTGYPLQEAGKYALAKTWPAHEMSRPGCVWTHTILVNFSDIPRIEDLSDLASFFRKPEDSLFDGYRETINYSIESNENLEPDYNYSGLEELIYLLYSEQCTVELSNKIVSEEMLLKVWSQQWPKLRRSFSFRTWNNKRKSKNKIYFDVLLNVDDFFSEDALFIKDNDHNWLKDAIADISRSNGGELRKFLWKHGGNTVDTRVAYVVLLKAWKLAQNKEESYSKLSLFLLEWSSRPSSITRDIANSIDYDDSRVLSTSTTKLLITDIGYIKQDDLSKLGEVSLGKSLGINCPELLINVIEPWTDHSLGIVRGAIDTIPEKYLFDFLRSNPELIERLLYANKRILEMPNFWKDKGISQGIIRFVNKESSEKVISAIIDSNEYQYADHIFDHVKKISCIQVLDKMEEGLDEKWIYEAAKNPELLLSSIKDHPGLSKKSLNIVSRYLSPFATFNDGDNDDAWITALKKSKPNKVPETLALFLMKRALSGVSAKNYDLLRYSFSICYELIHNYRIELSDWNLINNVLPNSYGWLPIISRKDKFIDGIAIYVIQQGFSAKQIFELTNETKLMKKLIFSLSIKYGGVEVAKEVGKKIY